MNKYQKKPEIKTKKNSNYKSALSETSSENTAKDMITSLDTFFGKHLKKIFYLGLLLTVILSVYMFDVRIHEGGDDSGYIEMAYNFIKGKSFPTFHGEFYSIFLGLPILIFGLNVVVLKIFSFLFIIGQLIFFYQAFKNRISPTILAFTLILTSVSSNILFFGSQTYTEAMYLFLQSIAIFFIFKIIESLKENKLNNLDLWKYWLLSGFTIFLMSITRNIGITILISFVLILIITGKFYAVFYSLASFFIFSIPFGLYKKIVWNVNQSGISQQMDLVLYKNPYNPALGTENFNGMVTRFIENTKIYISRYFFQSIGLKDPTKTDSTLLPAIILVIILLIALYFSFRRNKHLLFIGIYLAGSIFTTFVTLAQSWGQLRMIVIFIPLIVLFASWGIYELSKFNKLKFLFPLLLFLFVIIFFKSLGQSIIKAKANQKVLAKNIDGNKYYGFTPDWVNFLKLSEWVGKNIPENVVVASRKPSMSFIYSGGKEFYGIYRMPSENGDSLINIVKDNYNELSIFNLNEINNKKIPGNLQLALKNNFVGFMVVNNDIFGITNNTDGKVKEIIDQYKVQQYANPDSFLSYVHNRKETYYGVQPDSLISTLRKNDVRYVILASLRMNPNMKTDNIISTVQRYLYFIELKYPYMFQVVQQFGNENDEPSKLVKLNYEYYSM